LPADRTLVEEEHDAARAPARVDVANEVTIAVAYEVPCAEAPLVSQAVVQRARDTAHDLLDGLLVFHRRSLHEPAHIPDNKRQVRSV
jgi:hypothetical protein